MNINMSNLNIPNNTLKKQQGTSLVVALVLIGVSTLVGMSVLRNSDLGAQLVNNEKFHELVFLSAESAVGQILTSDNIVTISESQSNDCIVSNDSVDSKTTTTTELCPNGFGFAEGFRIGEGINGYQMNFYYAESNATLEGVDTTKTVLQGAQHLSLSQ